jgi:NADH-quinone oxidoreductase subunit E
MQIINRLETLIGIQAGETSDDLEYTLETVNCLGACALGPIVVTDDGYDGMMTIGKVDKLIRRVHRQDAEAQDTGKPAKVDATSAAAAPPAQ